MTVEVALQRALARKEQLEAELRELNTFLAVYQRFAKEVPAPAPENVPELFSRVGTGAVSEAEGKPPAMTQEDFVALARDILVGNGRPMTRSQLLAAFKARGRHVGGIDEQKNLGTKIWRARDRILNIPGAGYWPKDLPCPAVAYTPETPPADSADLEDDTRRDKMSEMLG
jgi:hypothetical protein